MVAFNLTGLFSWNLCSISASMLETIVRPGDNITLYCDCRPSLGVYIVWFRNCSHRHQPTLEVKTIGGGTDIKKNENLYPRFKFLKNQLSDSFDLLIINVTDSDEGLYYCGTIENKVEKKENVYGNISTRITLCKFFFLI
uniref:Ig-like domain-containing protein n=1 Tax=Cyprinodon variegatus TaxID=28743 RepID=A0A3Q2EB01_CYPVA